VPPLTTDEGAVLEALAVRPATIDRLAEKLGWDTARVTAVVDRLRADGFVFGAGRLELSGSGRFHLPSEKGWRIDPS
jgi:predicted transcriptional regulator